MKLYRFAVHPEEDGYFFLECINDPSLFTQARSMDDALYMARDVVESMYEIKGVIIELVVPPDVVTAYQRKRLARGTRRKTRSRGTAKAA
jgi:predicted RNase H-like HicB family nuclease